MAREYPTVLDLVGGTPLVRLQRVAADLGPTLLAKLEHVSPGGSVKDRIGLRHDRGGRAGGEARGPAGRSWSRPAGTPASASRSPRRSRATGASSSCRTRSPRRSGRSCAATAPRSSSARPRSRPSLPRATTRSRTASREEIPGAFKPDQYSNPANPQAHYETTGPEIWEQTGGEVDAIVFSVGTGGTISGTARYLREQKPDLLVVGADPEGSIFSQPDNVHPYLVEGIGEDFWPTTFDSSLVDEYVSVSDGDSFRTARRLAREEGLLVGGSGGTAVWAMLEIARRFGPEATLVTLIPDSGRGYLSKLYDDNWLMEHGFLEREAPAPTIEEVLAFKRQEEPAMPELVTVESHQKVGEAIDLMQRYSISQIPVVRHDGAESLADVVGSIRERGLFERVFRSHDALADEVAVAMEPPLPAVEIDESVDTVFADLSAGNPAVVVARRGKPVGVLTRPTSSSTSPTVAPATTPSVPSGHAPGSDPGVLCPGRACVD